MKNKKGISLIALVVTVIVLIILAAIIINYSFNQTIDNTAFTRRVSEMTEVYDAVVQRGIEHKIDENMYPYIPDEDLSSNPKVINGVTYGEGYYYISTAEEKKALGLERVLGNYLVSYESGEVVSTTRIEYEGRDYYKLSDISGAVQGGSINTANGEYDEAQGVNKPILSDGMVPVKESGSSWIVTTEDDGSWYDYKNGKYATIMLMDELTLNNATNEQVRKMSREELNSLANSRVTTPGSTFVWIPRYTYNDSGEIVYSYLTQDYIDAEKGFMKSSAFYFGGYTGGTDVEQNSGYVGGGKELTGIWVSKYEAGFNQ